MMSTWMCALKHDEHMDAVLEIRSKWRGWTNVLATLFWVRQFQICSDIFLEKYTCATVDVPQ